MKYNTNPVKGMRDLMPREVVLREHITSVIAATYARYGFQRIETPAVEHIELLQNSEGGENLSLIFKILKRGEKLDLTAAAHDENLLVDSGLRYDLTVPLARFFANHRAQLPDPFKSVQIGTVYRAERPQKGRFRAFTQCDIDILGESSEIAELELINATGEALRVLGLRDFNVEINDRRVLAALVSSLGIDASLTSAIAMCVDKLEKIGRDKVIDEIVAAGVDHELASKFVAAMLALNLDNLETHGVPVEVAAALRRVVHAASQLAGDSFAVRFTPGLARGMGYYTGMVFEITAPGVGYSLAGGGRYDGLIGKLSGLDVPAVGFSIGFERILLLLEQQGFVPPAGLPTVALLYPKESAEPIAVMIKAGQLRAEGYTVRMVPEKAKLGKQLKGLESEGVWGYYSWDKEKLIEFGG